MTALTRSIFCSCLLVSLAACIEPPSASDGGKASAGAQPGVAGEQAQAQAKVSTEPGFTGAPVSTATLAGGLVLDDFLIGTGDEAKPGSEVSVHYTGTLDDGTVFDTSKKRGRPYKFTVGQGRVIKGWDQGLPGMKVGGKRRLTVPSDLAYGPRQKGKIPANSRLTFTIELIEVVPPLPPGKGDEAFTGEPVQRTELEGGLVIEEFAAGDGKAATAGNNVAVHYTGKLDDGTVFDSSLSRNKPISFVLGRGRVIKGWDLGIEGMKVGGLRRLTIPAELAYGPRAKGKIPADSRLTFTVELMSIRDAPAQPKRPAPRPH